MQILRPTLKLDQNTDPQVICVLKGVGGDAGQESMKHVRQPLPESTALDSQLTSLLMPQCCPQHGTYLSA